GGGGAGRGGVSWPRGGGPAASAPRSPPRSLPASAPRLCYVWRRKPAGERLEPRRRTMQRDGRVNSGDVSIFYRAFGMPGRTPILLMHGANYFDSYDWIGVAGALATDREVATYDKRGFGESGWSPSKDDSVDAKMGDGLAVIG